MKAVLRIALLGLMPFCLSFPVFLISCFA